MMTATDKMSDCLRHIRNTNHGHSIENNHDHNNMNKQHWHNIMQLLYGLQ